MKNSRVTTTVLGMAFISLMSLSCKDGAQEQTKTATVESVTEADAIEAAPVSFTDTNVKEIFEQYLQIKTSLVNSNALGAHSGAVKLMGLTNDSEMRATLRLMAESKVLEVQRTAFSELTAQMTSMVDESLSSGAVYKQFCPMAFNNEGGYWLSTESEIRNPYYGDRMLKCGRVTETLGSK